MSFTITIGMTTEQIQALLDNENCGYITFQPGTYNLEKSLHINRDNVTIDGHGAVLIMEPNANDPNISIGTRGETTDPAPEVKNINISNLVLDGNREKQTSEFSKRDKWIRNNCLDIRKTNGLTVTNVHCRNARSGGIVVSWYSSNMIFNNVQSYGHQFDGIAFYTAHSCIVTNFILHSNEGAGLSLDNDLRDSLFTNGVIRNNSDVGLFVRETYHVTFSALQIFNNKSHGVFLGDNYDTRRGPECTIRGSGGVGVYNSAIHHGKKLSMQGCVLGPANANGNANENFRNFTKSNDNVQYIK